MRLICKLNNPQDYPDGLLIKVCGPASNWFEIGEAFAELGIDSSSIVKIRNKIKEYGKYSGILNKRFCSLDHVSALYYQLKQCNADMQIGETCSAEYQNLIHKARQHFPHIIVLMV